ncbi:MAG: MBL fold metallo-hydrolase, partial [Lachnospiraceae bacterium]|nr:MBL fold metallo-hydrolase [Lachnospiraceae bacterium]
ELPEIPEKKPLYVFASHRHGDHFSEVIFDLAKKYENMIFVLSYDIEEKRVPEPLRGRTYFLKPDEIWEHEGLKVETYRSTDEGVAFWCSADGNEIYHAGDLNHWYWDGEDEQWNKDMTAAYRSEIAKMRGRTADVAFLPLDPRQEQYFYLGIDDFVKEVHVKHIFPMHFWDQFDVGERLKALPCSEGYRDRIIEIKQEEHEYEV